MTIAIIPVKYNLQKTNAVLESLAAAGPGPRMTVIMCDDDYNLFRATSCMHLDNTKLSVYYDKVHRGYWQSINYALEAYQVSLDEPFIYLGNDVEFGRDWLSAAEALFYKTFPSGLGLLSFQDGIHGDFNASHGMTTRAWLKVVMGEPNFHREYWHYFQDSELTVRSKDLNGYIFCPESEVLHTHHDANVQYYRTDSKAASDYDIKERRHLEWVNGEREAARARLSA